MSTSPATFPSLAGALVPVDPQEPKGRLEQERREEKINAPRLTKFLNRTLDAIASLDQNENLKIHNEMIRCVAYYDGRWDGYLRNGEWVDNVVIDGEILPKDNEYFKQIEKLHMEMCRSRIGYEAKAVNKFSAKFREAAQFAQRRIEVNQERIETEPFTQAENKSLLLKLCAFRYTFFDRNADSQEKSIELSVMKHMTQGASIQVCRTCGTTAHPAKSIAKPVSDAAYNPQLSDDYEESRNTGYEATKVAGANCPNCGDTETKSIDAPESEGMETQQSEKSAGRVVSVRPDATMVQMDLNARDIPGSSFIRWRLVLRRCDWEAFFPNTKIPSSDESQESKRRSEAQNQSSNSQWGVSSSEAGGDQFEKIEGHLVWLDPKVYQRYENKEDETLGDDRPLAAGTKLIEVFPQGVCVARIGQKILDLYPSNKNKCWTMCVYGLREHALHGAGTTALLGPQDIINESNAKILANQTYMAAGREFVRSGSIEGGQLPSYDKLGIINGCPEDRDIVSWAYGRSQPETLAPDVYAFRTEMKGSLQDAAGTSSLSMQGAADVKVLGTATGVEASRDQAVGRMIPNRKLQAFAGTEWIRQVLALEQENYTPETFLAMAEKADEKGEIEYTERGVQAFFAMQISDLSINPKEGSWMPTTPAQDKANAAGFAEITKQVGGDPKMMSMLAPSFNQDYSVDEFGAAQRNAGMRMEEYARVCEIISKGGYPPSPEIVQVVLTNCAEWARPDPAMDNHPAILNYLTDWWMSDEGRNADGLLRAVVKAVFALHKQGITAQAQEQTTMQMAAQAPQMVAQEQMQAQQQQQGQEQAAQATEQGKQDQIEAAVGQQALAERDREHQSQTKMDETEHKAGIDEAAAQRKAVIDAAIKEREPKAGNK